MCTYACADRQIHVHTHTHIHTHTCSRDLCSSSAILFSSACAPTHMLVNRTMLYYIIRYDIVAGEEPPPVRPPTYAPGA